MRPKSSSRAFRRFGTVGWSLALTAICLIPATAVRADETTCDLSKMSADVQQTEAFFWHVYHGAAYTSTPTLRLALSNILDDQSKSLTTCETALVSARLAFSSFWIYNERGWVLKYGPKIDLFGKDYNNTSAEALEQLVFENYELAYSLNENLQIKDGVATKGPRSGPLDWSENKGIPSRKASKAWKEAHGVEESMLDDGKLPAVSGLSGASFRAVVAGFYATVNGVGGNKSALTLQGSIDLNAVFNFATPPFGDLGNAHLFPSDLTIMWQMMLLGERLDSVDIYETDENIGFDAAMTSMIAKLNEQKYAPFLTPQIRGTSFVQQAFATSSVYPIWFPYEAPSDTPVEPPNVARRVGTKANIAKASTHGSTVVPYNFENNFLLLGDAMFNNISRGRVAVVDDSWLEIVFWTYTYAKKSPTFDGWPHKDSIEKRLEKMKIIMGKAGSSQAEITEAWNTLQEWTGNIDTAANTTPPTTFYPSCMTCHNTKVR